MMIWNDLKIYHSIKKKKLTFKWLTFYLLHEIISNLFSSKIYNFYLKHFFINNFENIWDDIFNIYKMLIYIHEIFWKIDFPVKIIKKVCI